MRLLIALFVITLLISGCLGKNGVEKGNYSVNIIDSWGRSVNITSQPQRIVSLAPSNTEILFALGLGDRVVGVTEYCNYPEEAKQKEKIGGYKTVNNERVVALKPDLVVAEGGNGEAVFKALKNLGVTVIVLDAKNVEDVFDNIALVGRATGAEKNATLLIDSMKNRLESIKQKSNFEEAKRPKVLYIVWHNPVMCAGSDTYADELIGIAGGENIAGNLAGYKVIDLETILKENPDLIITSGMTTEDEGPTYDYVKNETRLSIVSALIQNRVYAINSDAVSRAGPRIVEALELFAGLINPSI